MDVIFISTSDSEGGAAKAQMRIFKKLTDIKEINLKMFVLRNKLKIHNSFNRTDLISIIYSYVHALIDSIFLLHIYKKYRNKWSFNLWKKNLKRWPTLDYDHIHIHSIAGGSFSLRNLSNYKGTIFLTMHDSWIYTAGCHINYDCINYQFGCKNCPQSRGVLGKIITRWNYQYKNKLIKNLNIVLIAPSTFIYDSASKSAMLLKKKIYLIHNGVDNNTFKPIFSKQENRKLLNLSNKFTLLYSALNPDIDVNKGIDRLISIINLIPANRLDKIQLIIVGTYKKFNLPIETHAFGKITDDIALSLIYSSADITLNCSYFESFGQVVLESLACGVPVIGYNSGGTIDIVKNNFNGYLLSNNKEIALKIIEILENNCILSSLSLNAVNYVEENFTLDITSKKYIDLYNENKNRHSI